MADFLDEWLAGKRRLLDTTRRDYGTHIRRYLTPALGRHRVQDLLADHIDQLYNDLVAGRYVGATAATVHHVHHVHRTLRAALNTAVRRRLIAWNPALQVELPEHRKARGSVWEAEDVARFLEACSEHRLYALFHLMAFTGMRRGEAIGLHWSEVDLDRAHLKVVWQIVDAGAGPQLGAPKTLSGDRVVPLDAATVDVLRDHRRTQAEERRAWGEGWQQHGLVFTKGTAACCAPTPSRTCSASSSRRRASRASACTTCGTRTRRWRCRPASTSRSSATASATPPAPSRATCTRMSCRPSRAPRPKASPPPCRTPDAREARTLAPC